MLLALSVSEMSNDNDSFNELFTSKTFYYSTKANMYDFTND